MVNICPWLIPKLFDIQKPKAFYCVKLNRDSGKNRENIVKSFEGGHPSKNVITRTKANQQHKILAFFSRNDGMWKNRHIKMKLRRCWIRKEQKDLCESVASAKKGDWKKHIGSYGKPPAKPWYFQKMAGGKMKKILKSEINTWKDSQETGNRESVFKNEKRWLEVVEN